MGLEAEQAWSSRAPPLSSMMNSMSPCACVSHLRTRAPYNAHRRQLAAAYEGALQLSRDAVLVRVVSTALTLKRGTRLHVDVDAVVGLEQRRGGIFGMRSERQRKREACDTLRAHPWRHHLHRAHRAGDSGAGGSGTACRCVDGSRHTPLASRSAEALAARSGRRLRKRPPLAR